MVAKHSDFPPRAGQDKTNDGRSSFTVVGVSEALIKHAGHAAICLGTSASPSRTLGEQEVATRGALAVLHHVVTGNYFIALKTRAHAPVRVQFSDPDLGSRDELFKTIFFFSLG